MEIKDRVTCTLCLRDFSRWVVASRARALGAAGNASDPVWKNPGGKVELNETHTNHES